MLRHSTILSVRFNQVEREKGGREGRGEEEDEEEEVEGGAGDKGNMLPYAENGLKLL